MGYIYILYIYIFMMIILFIMGFNMILVGGIPTPLKNDGVRQLG